jgi:hypothetical protein
MTGTLRASRSDSDETRVTQPSRSPRPMQVLTMRPRAPRTGPLQAPGEAVVSGARLRRGGCTVPCCSRLRFSRASFLRLLSFRQRRLDSEPRPIPQTVAAGSPGSPRVMINPRRQRNDTQRAARARGLEPALAQLAYRGLGGPLHSIPTRGLEWVPNLGDVLQRRRFAGGTELRLRAPLFVSRLRRQRGCTRMRPPSRPRRRISLTSGRCRRSSGSGGRCSSARCVWVLKTRCALQENRRYGAGRG